MKARSRWVLAVTLIFALTGCGSGAAPATTTPPTTPPTTQRDSSPAEGIPNIMDLPALGPIDPGTYFMDPDLDPSTPLRVVYEVPAEGWSMWSGAVKFGDDGHVAVSIVTVTNLVSDGCRDHSHAEPPVGPTVDDLATALADLAPFQVTSPPKDVTVYGYDGKHLELTVPDDLAVDESRDDRRFTACLGGQIKSWVAPYDTTQGDAYYGYTDSGYTEEFWIIDVEGIRLMIAAERSAGSPQKDLAELSAILDSIRIET
jgi:predicted small lipoprotein YifL